MIYFILMAFPDEMFINDSYMIMYLIFYKYRLKLRQIIK